MMSGYNFRKPYFHPLEAIRAALWSWWHKSSWEGRKALHGRFPACNWHQPTYPDRWPR